MPVLTARDRADALFGLRPGLANSTFRAGEPFVDYSALQGEWPVDPRGAYAEFGHYALDPAAYDGIAPGFSATSDRVAWDDDYAAMYPPTAGGMEEAEEAYFDSYMEDLLAAAHGLAPGGEARRGQLRRQAEQRARAAYEAQFDAQVLADAHQRGQQFWGDLRQRVTERRQGVVHDAPMRSYFRDASGMIVEGYPTMVEGYPTMDRRRFSYPPRFYPAGAVSNPEWYGRWR